MPAESRAEHLTEIATILAAGLLRLQTRKSSPNSPIQADTSLDCEQIFGRDETSDLDGCQQ
jgi:hypothetical protein